MANRPVELTDRQVYALTLLARGLGRAQIAREMQVSSRTVRNHLREGIFRLGATNGAHAVRIATSLQLIPATLQGAGHVR